MSVLDAGSITLADLRLSLDDFLSSKTPAPLLNTTPVQANLRDLLPFAHQSQSLAPPPQPPLTAAPAAQAVVKHAPVAATVHEAAVAAVAAPPPAAVAVAQTAAGAVLDLAEDDKWVDIETLPAGSFGGLSNEFLSGVQTALEDLGYNLTDSSVMQDLVSNPDLPEALLARLSSMMGGFASNVLREMIRQWQKAVAEQLELEKQLAKTQQRPVWRCAACGRYGCPVAPYIESYQEFDA